jgi:flagella synthesis protein FlgN
MANSSPATTLRDELTVLSSLAELMKQEQQFLIAADSDGLTALTPQKLALVGQLDRLSGQRHQTVAAARFGAGEAGMQAWLDSCNDPAASELWYELLSLTRAAKELNRVNGMLINKQMTHNKTLINAMRTPALGGETSIYGPSGQTTSSGPSRRFVAG